MKALGEVERADLRAATRYAGLDMATVWVAGGSGLVGGVLLRRLLQDDFFSKVVSVGRRTLPQEHPKFIQALNVSCLDQFARAARDYFARSALSREHFTSYRMKFWAEARRMLGQQREFVSMASELGMRDGYTAGVRPPPAAPRTSNGSMFCLSVLAPRRDQRTENFGDPWQKLIFFSTLP